MMKLGGCNVYRTDIEKQNDTLLIWQVISGLIGGIFMLALPFLLWYLSKFITFIQSEDFKMFIIGFSLCPFWIFVFMRIYDKKGKYKKAKKNDFYM